MNIEASTPEEYIQQIPKERKIAFQKLRQILLDNLPAGFEEVMSYGMIGYVVPKSLYPAGYHVNNELPLPFINLGSQKNFIALYHNGMYSDPELLEWFTTEYPNYSSNKLDMGKSCIRFKNPQKIPYELIAELARKITPMQWVTLYEESLK